MNPAWITQSKIAQFMSETKASRQDALEYLEAEQGNPAEAIEAWKADRGLLQKKEKPAPKPRVKAQPSFKQGGKQDYAANLALFLTEKKGSALAQWRGKMTADQQRQLFGRFLGKGMLYINGAEETIEHVVTVGFGLDYDVTDIVRWKDL